MGNEPTKKGGMYIPEWIWKAIQSLLLAAVVGGYGMFYTMHNQITKLEIQVAAGQATRAKLEGQLQERSNNETDIRVCLADIKAQLPFIKQGINDLKHLLR